MKINTAISFLFISGVISFFSSTEVICICPAEFADKVFIMDSGKRLSNSLDEMSTSLNVNYRYDNQDPASTFSMKHDLLSNDGKTDPEISGMVFNAVIISDVVILIIAWTLMFCYYRKDCIGATE